MTEPNDDAIDVVDVVFDGPPSHVCGRFVECENLSGASVGVGEWIDRGNGMWALRIDTHAAEVRRLREERDAGKRIEARAIMKAGDLERERDDLKEKVRRLQGVRDRFRSQVERRDRERSENAQCWRDMMSILGDHPDPQPVVLEGQRDRARRVVRERDEARARLATLQTAYDDIKRTLAVAADEMRQLRGTWCPECGPGVSVDEDGCCATCGATATGPGVDAIIAEVRQLREEVSFLRADRDGVVSQYEHVQDVAQEMRLNSEKAKRERDEARAYVSRLGRSVQNALDGHDHLCGQVSEDIQGEVDRIIKMRRERDQARAALCAALRLGEEVTEGVYACKRCGTTVAGNEEDQQYSAGYCFLCELEEPPGVDE